MKRINDAVLVHLRRVRRTASRGVTLVEVLIVVAIMALIAGGVSFGVLPRYREAQVKTAKTNARNIRNVATNHLALKGDCPSMASMTADKELDSGGDTKDPWGGEFAVSCEGDDITVRSPGPDKKTSTEDDILVGPSAPSAEAP